VKWLCKLMKVSDDQVEAHVGQLVGDICRVFRLRGHGQKRVRQSSVAQKNMRIHAFIVSLE
jgi:hypothetical protein